MLRKCSDFAVAVHLALAVAIGLNVASHASELIVNPPQLTCTACAPALVMAALPAAISAMPALATRR